MGKIKKTKELINYLKFLDKYKDVYAGKVDELVKKTEEFNDFIEKNKIMTSKKILLGDIIHGIDCSYDLLEAYDNCASEFKPDGENGETYDMIQFFKEFTSLINKSSASVVNMPLSYLKTDKKYERANIAKILTAVGTIVFTLISVVSLLTQGNAHPAYLTCGIACSTAFLGSREAENNADELLSIYENDENTVNDEYDLIDTYNNLVKKIDECSSIVDRAERVNAKLCKIYNLTAITHPELGLDVIEGDDIEDIDKMNENINVEVEKEA